MVDLLVHQGAFIEPTVPIRHVAVIACRDDKRVDHAPPARKRSQGGVAARDGSATTLVPQSVLEQHQHVGGGYEVAYEAA